MRAAEKAGPQEMAGKKRGPPQHPPPPEKPPPMPGDSEGPSQELAGKKIQKNFDFLKSFPPGCLAVNLTR